MCKTSASNKGIIHRVFCLGGEIRAHDTTYGFGESELKTCMRPTESIHPVRVVSVPAKKLLYT